MEYLGSDSTTTAPTSVRYQTPDDPRLGLKVRRILVQQSYQLRSTSTCPGWVELTRNDWLTNDHG